MSSRDSDTHVYHIEWTTVVSSLDANQARDLAVEDMHRGTSGQSSSQWLRKVDRDKAQP